MKCRKVVKIGFERFVCGKEKCREHDPVARAEYTAARRRKLDAMRAVYEAVGFLSDSLDPDTTMIGGEPRFVALIALYRELSGVKP